MDVQDAQWILNDAKLQTSQAAELTRSEFVVYKFAQFVTRMICMTFEMEPVNLCVADRIPSNNYAHNAFRHSFFYQRATRSLHIRKE